MSEMLANQYFIARRFSEAREEYLKLSPTCDFEISVLEKLIICNAIDGDIEAALRLLRVYLKDSQFTLDRIEKSIESFKDILKEQLQKIKLQANNNKSAELRLAILNFFREPAVSLNQLKNLSQFSGTFYLTDIISFLEQIVPEKSNSNQTKKGALL